MQITDLGIIGFHAALALQERLVAEVADGVAPETLLLVEHPPVYTIGSGGNAANVLDPAIDVVRINRGGDVTYHGPGQLVGYPIIDLSRRGRDLHRYLRFLEELLMRVAAGFGVMSRRVPGKTGIWTDRGKLASIGVGVRRWTTMHGFALNVDPDLRAFDRINPCGMAGCLVSSLAGETGVPVAVAAVGEQMAELFPRLLNESLPYVPNEQGGSRGC
jgi:lipoyl(octanoyl) transferase